MFTYLKKLFSPERINVRQLLDDGAIVIDVRSAGEFASGHYPGARNIPLDTIGSRAEELKRARKPLITVCRSGARSASAKAILEKAGLEVYNGGAWTNLKHLV